MTTDYYVDPAGSATEPYDTWAKAAATVADVLAGTVDPVVGGDRIFVINTYDNGGTSAKTWAGISNTVDTPVLVISTSDTANEPPLTYARGATERVSSGAGDVTVSGTNPGFVVAGFDWISADEIFLTATAMFIKFIDCKQEINGTSSADEINITTANCTVIYEDCEFEFGQAGQGFNIDDGCRLCLMGCNLSATGTAIDEIISTLSSRGAFIEMLANDFSNGASGFSLLTAPASAGSGGNTSKIEVWNNKLPATSAVLDGTPPGDMEVRAFNNGPDDVPNILFKNGRGTVEHDTAVYLDATYDGTNGYSLKMTASVDTQPGVFELRYPIAELYLASANPTIGVEIITGASNTIDDQKFWLEVEYPDATDTLLSKISRTRNSNYGLGTAGTVGSSAVTWTGEGTLTGETKYAESITISGGAAGKHVVYACYAPGAAETIYVDPAVNIT